VTNVSLSQVVFQHSVGEYEAHTRRTESQTTRKVAYSGNVDNAAYS